MEPIVLLLLCGVLARGVMAVAEDLSVATWEGTRDAGVRAYRAANERYGRVRDATTGGYRRARDAAVARAETMPAANPRHPGWWLWLLGAAGYHGGRNLRRGIREAGEIISGGWRRGTREGNAWKAEVEQRRSNAKNPNDHACEMRGKGNGACTKGGVVAKREDVDPAGWLCRDHWRARLNAPPSDAPDAPDERGSRPASDDQPSSEPAPEASAPARADGSTRPAGTDEPSRPAPAPVPTGVGRLDPQGSYVRCDDCGVSRSEDPTVADQPADSGPWSVLCDRCRDFHQPGGQGADATQDPLDAVRERLRAAGGDPVAVTTPELAAIFQARGYSAEVAEQAAKDMAARVRDQGHGVLVSSVPDSTAPTSAAPSGEPKEGNTVSAPIAEGTNLEVAAQVARQLAEMATRDVEAATQRKNDAEARIARLDAFAAQLASAGISGPVMEALSAMSENAGQRKATAEADVANANKDHVDAAKALEGFQRHEAAADSLAATGGAAKTTAFYGVQH